PVATAVFSGKRRGHAQCMRGHARGWGGETDLLRFPGGLRSQQPGQTPARGGSPVSSGVVWREQGRGRTDRALLSPSAHGLVGASVSNSGAGGQGELGVFPSGETGHPIVYRRGAEAALPCRCRRRCQLSDFTGTKPLRRGGGVLRGGP